MRHLLHKQPEIARVCLPSLVVHGHWSEWSEWSECDALCGGGIKTRNRSCSSPPPKNGGRDCYGMTLQSQSCNSHPCTNDTDVQRGKPHYIKTNRIVLIKMLLYVLNTVVKVQRSFRNLLKLIVILLKVTNLLR